MSHARPYLAKHVHVALVSSHAIVHAMLRDAAQAGQASAVTMVMAAVLAKCAAMVADDDKDGVRLGATGRREHGVQSRDE